MQPITIQRMPVAAAAALAELLNRVGVILAPRATPDDAPLLVVAPTLGSWIADALAAVPPDETEHVVSLETLCDFTDEVRGALAAFLIEWATAEGYDLSRDLAVLPPVAQGCKLLIDSLDGNLSEADLEADRLLRQHHERMSAPAAEEPAPELPPFVDPAAVAAGMLESVKALDAARAQQARRAELVSLTAACWQAEVIAATIDRSPEHMTVPANVVKYATALLREVDAVMERGQ